MRNKLMMACMAIAAFAAFALPSTASAANTPTLVDAGGALPHGLGTTGATIVGTNVGEVTITSTSGDGVVHCTNAKLTGHVHQNTNGTVEATIEKFLLWGTGAPNSDNGLPECTTSFGGGAYITVTNDLCIRSTPAMATHEFQIHAGACTGTQAKVELVIGSTSVGACEYRATGTIKGDYTTGSSDRTLVVRNTSAGSGAEKISGSFLCSASLHLEMTFTLETENGDPVWATHAP